MSRFLTAHKHSAIHVGSDTEIQQIQPRKANNAEYSETVQYKYNADQAIDQWRVHLNACVKAKGKHFENML